MSIRRVWLDWDKPCLPEAAEWVIGASQAGASPQFSKSVDLRTVVCVLPGRRAGRVFLAQLIERCRDKKLSLIPPRVLTPGAMLEALAPVDQAVASDLESTFAWTQALQRCDRDALAALLPTPPEHHNLMAWHNLAATIHRLHVELAGARLTFADVADRAKRMEMPGEGDRWDALQTLSAHYARALADCGLADGHWARQAAIDRQAAGEEHAGSPRIGLIAVTDLNRLQRDWLAARHEQVTALIHAPDSFEAQFDELGCIRPESWFDHRLEIDDAIIRIADRPDDQAQMVLRGIGDLNGGYAAEQITIGLGDESLTAPIERAAQWAGVSVRSAAGRSMARSGPLQFLESAAGFVSEHRFAHLAALLRHPDVEQWLNRTLSGQKNSNLGVRDWLTLLDRYFSDFLHERLSGAWLGDESRNLRLKMVHQAICRLLAPLTSAQVRPLSAWAHAMVEVLSEPYDGAEDRWRMQSTATCEAFLNIAAEWTSVAAALQPEIDATTAMRLMLTSAAQAAAPERLAPNQIELLGWLELHLDLAPALIIAAFNDGQIPQTAATDPFLPDSLRSALGLTSNDTRYARDAYLLEAIRHSRPHLTLVSGRHTADGEPLSPSRLLLACDDQTLVRRVGAMCRRQADQPKPPPIGIAVPPHGQRSMFRIPELPHPLPPRTYMTVTEFKSYLACPYRYALERLLDLEPLGDEARELDPLQFGSLAHQVLCAFGSDGDVCCSDDADTIEKFLFSALAKEARRFGADPLPAVRVQIARLEARLRSFARFQAKLCAQGWRIRHCELSFDGRVALDIPDQPPMPIRGKIDRIDHNERTGAWLVIDYKTGESGKSPHQAHHGVNRLNGAGKLEWLDLQLPLYWHLATNAELGISAHDPIQLAYICLPKQTDGACLKCAEWTGDHLDQAINLARDVVMNIRAGRFERNPDFDARHDPFPRICQSTVFAEDDLAEFEP